MLYTDAQYYTLMHTQVHVCVVYFHTLHTAVILHCTEQNCTEQNCTFFCKVLPKPVFSMRAWENAEWCSADWCTLVQCSTVYYSEELVHFGAVQCSTLQ